MFKNKIKAKEEDPCESLSEFVFVICVSITLQLGRSDFCFNHCSSPKKCCPNSSSIYGFLLHVFSKFVFTLCLLYFFVEYKFSRTPFQLIKNRNFEMAPRRYNNNICIVMTINLIVVMVKQSLL